MSCCYPPTHQCGCLGLADAGQQVSLCGWVHRYRDHGGLIFIDLRDRSGITQLIFDPKRNSASHAVAETLRSEWVIAVQGEVISRSPTMVNPQLSTGEIELLIDELHILSVAQTPPFSLSDETIEVNEELRLKYRYLDLRRGKIAQNLRQRHRAMIAARRFLDGEGFTEVTTPMLGKSTPEGARDYLVPSRIHPGHFYALPQSPQLYKQLLMIGGIERYYQIASCFRDEDLRADRQPEFSQIDIEMSFSDKEHFLPLVEQMIAKIFLDAIGVQLTSPFRRLSHAQAFDRYGCDRPDMRFGMEMSSLNDIASASSFTVFLNALEQGALIKGFCVKGGADISRKAIDGYTQFVAKFGLQGLAWMKYQEGALTSSIVKFFDEALQRQLIERFAIEEGDLLLMLADEADRVNQALDHLRRHIAKERKLIDNSRYEFVWIDEFPLFSFDREERRLCSEHHPFTQPHPDDLHLLESSPLKVRSIAYDLVLNGYELGGGSQRIHDPQMQKKIFQLLQLSDEQIKSKFGFFVEALQYGTPPHLGIAFGLDRIVMLLCGCDNIRDVIAFPKTQNASDLMNSSPSGVAEHQLQELRLRCISSSQ